MTDSLAYLIIGLIIGLFGGLYWIRWRTNQELMFENHANLFFDNIRPMIDDDETPPDVIDIIDFFNRQITNRGLALAIIVRLLSKSREFQIENTKSESTEIDRFFERRPELFKSFAEAIFHAAIALTYRGPVAGWFLRHLVFFNLNRLSNRPAVVASDLKSVYSERNEKCARAAA